jgi:hypothetical protein
MAPVGPKRVKWLFELLTGRQIDLVIFDEDGFGSANKAFFNPQNACTFPPSFGMPLSTGVSGTVYLATVNKVSNDNRHCELYPVEINGIMNGVTAVTKPRAALRLYINPTDFNDQVDLRMFVPSSKAGAGYQTGLALSANEIETLRSMKGPVLVRTTISGNVVIGLLGVVATSDFAISALPLGGREVEFNLQARFDSWVMGTPTLAMFARTYMMRLEVNVGLAQQLTQMMTDTYNAVPFHLMELALAVKALSKTASTEVLVSHDGSCEKVDFASRAERLFQDFESEFWTMLWQGARQTAENSGLVLADYRVFLRNNQGLSPGYTLEEDLAVLEADASKREEILLKMLVRANDGTETYDNVIGKCFGSPIVHPGDGYRPVSFHNGSEEALRLLDVYWNFFAQHSTAVPHVVQEEFTVQTDVCHKEEVEAALFESRLNRLYETLAVTTDREQQKLLVLISSLNQEESELFAEKGLGKKTYTWRTPKMSGSGKGAFYYLRVEVPVTSDTEVVRTAVRLNEAMKSLARREGGVQCTFPRFRRLTAVEEIIGRPTLDRVAEKIAKTRVVLPTAVWAAAQQVISLKLTAASPQPLRNIQAMTQEAFLAQPEFSGLGPDAFGSSPTVALVCSVLTSFLSKKTIKKEQTSEDKPNSGGNTERIEGVNVVDRTKFSKNQELSFAGGKLFHVYVDEDKIQPVMESLRKNPTIGSIMTALKINASVYPKDLVKMSIEEFKECVAADGRVAIRFNNALKDGSLDKTVFSGLSEKQRSELANLPICAREMAATCFTDKTRLILTEEIIDTLREGLRTLEKPAIAKSAGASKEVKSKLRSCVQPGGANPDWGGIVQKSVAAGQARAAAGAKRGLGKGRARGAGGGANGAGDVEDP